MIFHSTQPLVTGYWHTSKLS